MDRRKLHIIGHTATKNSNTESTVNNIMTYKLPISQLWQRQIGSIITRTRVVGSIFRYAIIKAYYCQNIRCFIETHNCHVTRKRHYVTFITIVIWEPIYKDDIKMILINWYTFNATEYWSFWNIILMSNFHSNGWHLTKNFRKLAMYSIV